MPDTKADVIVIGLGAMGSAACYHLAKAGARVLGIEQFDVAHDRGSSHGETRLIRQAYFEHPDYVPLLKKSYELWEALCAEGGQSLFHKNGLVTFGHPQDSRVIAGTRASASLHKIPIEELDPAECARRFPYFRPPPGYVGIVEPEAGYLEVEACNRAHVALAQKHGARVQTQEAVASIKANGPGFTVQTTKGTYHSDILVVTAGAWSSQILAELALPLQVRRMVLGWFAAPDLYRRENAVPCFALDHQGRFRYGFPKISGSGMKLADHSSGAAVSDPSAVDRQLRGDDLTTVQEIIPWFLSGVDPKPLKSAVCMYTMSPDEHFIVDAHPRHDNFYFAAGFSGHGFKFSPVIGKVLCDLALSGKTKLPVKFLRLARASLRKTSVQE